MSVLTLKGRGIVEGTCRAEALASTRPISFLGGIDPGDGRVIERNHDLCGVCIRDKILVFPHGHGSTVGSYVMYSLAKKGLAPAAIINQTADPVVVVGAIIANIPMIDKIDISNIRTGDTVEVDGLKGVARILQRKKS
jgi:predicted aconitase with swiveling domain